MKKVYRNLLRVIFFGIILLGSLSPQATAGDITVKYLYDLSNFSGKIPYQWANLFVDPSRNEVYAIDIQENEVSVFNPTGMEIYRFSDNGELGSILSGAVDDDGNILLLTVKHIAGEIKHTVWQCNYRGEPVSEIRIEGLPAGFSGFAPTLLFLRENKLYLVDTGALVIIIADKGGRFKEGYDIVTLLEIEEKRNALTGIFGFCVDGDGNMIFTVPSLFKAFRLAPGGDITGFGKSGSGPGRFGIPSAVASDVNNYYYISDRVRCVVLVFDRSLNFQTEFGYRGYGAGNLIAPDDLAVDSGGRVYVSQAASRGVSVFKVNHFSSNKDITSIPEQEGGDRKPNKEKILQEVRGNVAVYRTFAKHINLSSEKGKPTARWGHKADGSTGGDGRAAGEEKGGKR